MTFARSVIPLLAWIIMPTFSVVSGFVAASESPKQINCTVTHSIDCVDDECQKTAEEHAHIDLILELPKGEGNLCTATYCRAITWLDIVGDNKLQTFGAVRSSASGSTQEKQDNPVVDFYLWVEADRKAFSLIPVDGNGSSWSGNCNIDMTAVTLKAGQSEITLYRMDTLFVSKDCITGDCIALRPAHKKAQPSNSPWVGHPAAAFCRANDGDDLTGKHPNGDEDGICRFKDGSMIMDWDYYYRNNH